MNGSSSAPKVFDEGSEGASGWAEGGADGVVSSPNTISTLFPPKLNTRGAFFPRLRAVRDRPLLDGERCFLVMPPVYSRGAAQARAACRHGAIQPNAAGALKTIRRAVSTTCTESLMMRSRSVDTCARTRSG